MDAQFIIRDGNGNTYLDLSNSVTKIIGKMTVTASGTHHIPQLANQRGWFYIRGINWNNNNNLSLCKADLDNNGNLTVTLTRGSFDIIYGIY